MAWFALKGEQAIPCSQSGAVTARVRLIISDLILNKLRQGQEQLVLGHRQAPVCPPYLGQETGEVVGGQWEECPEACEGIA